MEFPYKAILEVVEYAQDRRENHRKEDGSKVSKVRVASIPGTDAEVIIDFTNQEE